MCVNLCTPWQSRLAKTPNLFSHPRKHSQQDCLPRNRRGTALRISRTISPTRLPAQKSKRHRSPNFESQISLDKICPQSSHATSAFWIPQTTFSKCSDKVKTREPCSDHYIALTEKGKGTALPLAVGTIPIYVDLHPPQPGRPAKKCSTLPHIRNGTPNLASRNTPFSSPSIIPMPTSHIRARISHIIRVESKSIPYHAFSLSFPLPLLLPAGQGERMQSVGT